MRAVPPQRWPARAEPESVPETDAAARFTLALSPRGMVAGGHVGGLGQGPPAVWCAFPGGPASRRLAGALARARRLCGPMSGWVIPPPSRPLKSDEELRRERQGEGGGGGGGRGPPSPRGRGGGLPLGRGGFFPPPL